MKKDQQKTAMLNLIKERGMTEEYDHINPSELAIKLRTEYKTVNANYILADIVENTFKAEGYERQGVSFYKRNAGFIRLILPLYVHFVENIDLYYVVAHFGLLNVDYYTSNGINVPRFPRITYFDPQILYPTKEKLNELGCAHKSLEHLPATSKTVTTIEYKEWYLHNEEWLNWEAGELIAEAEKLYPFPDTVQENDTQPSKSKTEMTTKYDLLTAQGAEKYLAEIDQLQWFENTTIKRDDTLKYLQDHKSKPFLWVTALGENWIDCEGYETIDSYLSLLEEFLDTAQIKFKNLNGSDDGDIHFSTAKNDYHYQIPDFGETDWLDENFVETFINNEILVKENHPKRFFAIPSMDQSAQFMLLTPNLYQQAIAKGIIPENMNYYEDKDDLLLG